MKLVMTLLVRDEEDILRANLDFHLAKGVDEFILMDNLSGDGTEKIAREYERAGRLRYLFQANDDYAQADWVTAMARLAYDEAGADWVINSDADEFWFPRTASLKDALAALPDSVNAAVAERANFVGRSLNGAPFWERMNVRRTASFNALGRPLPPKVAHRARADVDVAQGNHAVRFASEPVVTGSPDIDILHFPVRSQAQYRNKIVKGGLAYSRNTALSPDVGNTWRHLYSLYLRGEFGEACASEILTDEEVERGLMSGELVHDDRLANALSGRT